MTEDTINQPAAGTPPAWTAQLEPDLRSNEILTQQKTITDLGKSYLDLHGKSQNAIQLIGEDATDEDRATFFNKLGRPETPDGYELARPELPEGMPYDEAKEAQYRKIVHEAGLTKTQSARLYKALNEEYVENHKALQQQRMTYHDEQVTSLQTEWGNEYEGRAEKNAQFVAKIGGEDFTKWLDTSGLGDSPLMIRFIDGVRQLISEDTLLRGGYVGGGGLDNAADQIFPEMATRKGG